MWASVCLVKIIENIKTSAEEVREASLSQKLLTVIRLKKAK
jgi:hypothetical protein